MQFGPEHAFSASSDLRMIKMLDAEITGLEQQVRDHLAAIPAAWGIDADGVTGPGAGTGPDAAVLPAVDRLAEIPGVGPATAAGLIAEIGLDMSRFPTPHALVSWAGLAPVAASPGPARAAGRKATATPTPAATPARPPTAPPAPTRSSASATAASARPGGGGWKKANVAVGRSILIIVWHLLNDPAARFTDLGPDYYARHTDTNRKARNHKRQLEALGYDVILTPREAA